MQLRHVHPLHAGSCVAGTPLCLRLNGRGLISLLWVAMGREWQRGCCWEAVSDFCVSQCVLPGACAPSTFVKYKFFIAMDLIVCGRIGWKDEGGVQFP